MLERFHLMGIDEADISPEQWEAFIRFASHNFGNLFNGATLIMQNARDGRVDGDLLDKTQRAIRAEYFDIVETMKALRDGRYKGTGMGGEAVVREEEARAGRKLREAADARAQA